MQTQKFLWAINDPGGGGDFAAGIFRRGTFRVSNSREISHPIFMPLCEIRPLRKVAKFLVQQLPEHLETVYGGIRGWNLWVAWSCTIREMV